MKLEFIKLSPTQNMTVIVKTPVERSQHSRVAAALMDYAGVFAEQAGFLEKATLPGAVSRLQMMGGEFCGNAAMCMAACIARDMGIEPGDETDVTVEISGAQEALVCHVRCGGDGFFCRVGMPRPGGMEMLGDICVVHLPGIAHAIVKCDDTEALRDGAEAMLRDVSARLDEDAVGLMLYSEKTGRMLPLVYVKATDTMIWERGCGSGSAAVGAMLAYESKADAAADISQPGGVIRAEACWNDGEVSVSIEGKVRIVCEGTAYI